MKTIGENIPPEALVLIETTVAPGTTEFVAWPILKKAFAKRGLKETPLLSHSFERVMPGKEYVSSIRDFWRVCSGCNKEARDKVEKFLHEISAGGHEVDDRRDIAPAAIPIVELQIEPEPPGYREQVNNCIG